MRRPTRPDPYCGFKNDQERRKALVSRDVRLVLIAMVRGGFGFSDRGVSGLLPGHYSNRRADIHEKAKT
jgi:hypothetical protein